MLSAQSQTKVGTPLNVGDLSTENVVNPVDAMDGREPVELLARIIAHIGHRIPFFSKVEARLEGTDARSGFVSDLLAFLGQMWARNRDLAPVFVAQAAQRKPQQNPGAGWEPVTDVPFATGSDRPQPTEV